MKELKVEFFGRVQGVGFRQYIKKYAESLSARGYVRNREDGSVVLIAQGKRTTLQKLLESVQKGPFFAKVKRVAYSWETPTIFYPSFSIMLDKTIIEDQKAAFKNLGRSLLRFGPEVPLHVAIIPDGNRRWAKEKGLPVAEGHRRSASYDHFTSILEEAHSLGIRYLTFWAFSTENWRRDTKEVDVLFDMVLGFLRKYTKELMNRKIRFRHLGRRDRIPKKIVEEIVKIEEMTKSFTEYNLQVCLDYGGRDEIARAVNKILKAGIKEVNEEDIIRYLDSADIPDPDLVIRTSGEHRTSGFMPFQSSYAELYFSEVYYPDFDGLEFRKAVEEFARRKRNYGK